MIDYYTPEDDAKIREMWPDPANTTAVIAAALHRKRNSVIGRIHRLDLPRRPSPIIRDGAPVELGPRVKRAPPPRKGRTPRAAKPFIPQAPIKYVPWITQGDGCLYITDNSRRGAPIFCDAPRVTEGSGSYCAEHRAVCIARTIQPANPWVPNFFFHRPGGRVLSPEATETMASQSLTTGA